MKKFGLAGIVAGALSAAVIGFAGPAQAQVPDLAISGHGHGYHYGYDRDDRYYPWLDQLYPTVRVPHVDTSVHN
ncbi:MULTISPECIES: hypothetical protein [unclassified Mycobacterium]|uniref:hypothetical protein n=1 Tax=unclassified Mycobacterium TaxID=2642494 RepID=UPI003432BFFA